MDAWYCKSLGDGMSAHLPMHDIAELFRPMHAAAGHPPAMAVFTRHESDGHLHCEVTVFFSPAAAELARALGAIACPEPAPERLDLLAGSPASFALLFPAAGTP
ncbi:hypothetical protein [Chitinimonas koreensis]|uniref:hypothetical protein n=1 Tax=Chitinimonas koreensis TaxID=356302 RepID=UPI00042A0138|nr:hypothetical protein [Chitinimonas koreensis]QNM95156.1 hypothetical protein H9L41_14860 [Chitinimonas koreensis]